jgi:hypothetical protein
MEEILALFCVCLLTGIGWVAAKLCFAKIISEENSIYYAPALGAGICGVVAYIAVKSYQPWLIGVFCLAVTIVAVVFRKRLRSGSFCSSGPVGRSKESSLAIERQSDAAHRAAATEENDSWQLVRFTALTVLGLYGMQIALYAAFSRMYPAPHEVWSLFNLTGTPPPDQMFAWHQAMFADQHKHYPQDPFYNDMDLYDRPQLGGYITLFLFKLFRLQLTEANQVYPPHELHFYHCLWWLLNNLYLFGVAPLFRKMFGYRGAIIAVATTALGGFFFLCTAGGWTKFAGGYPFLLALLLYVENQGPALQAALCAMSYYIHGSVLPFLAGFGLLQLLNLRYPIMRRRLTSRSVGIFAAVGVILVGAWFIVVRLVGSKQPLFYYYLYAAGLTEAQTTPVAEIAQTFYAKHTWATLSLLPARHFLTSWFPFELFQPIQEWVGGAPITASRLASTIFALQRFCIECGLGIVAAPIVLLGLFKTLAQEHAGKIAFCLYLVPTLLIALIYRLEWPFSLHILVPYQAICLFLWIMILEKRSTMLVAAGLTLIALEGAVCVLFADTRFLPVKGLEHVGQLTAPEIWWLITYLMLIVAILVGATWQVIRFGVSMTEPSPVARPWQILRTAGMKLLAGLVVIAGVFGLYALYCLRFYPR